MGLDIKTLREVYYLRNLGLNKISYKGISRLLKK